MFDARDQAKLTFVAVILCCASTVAAAEHPFVANLRAKGLDPAKLSFVFETAERGLLGDYYGGLHASYNGQFVGSLNMHYDRESARCRSIHPIIELDIRRKGLGSVMYLLAAELAFAHDQSVLGYDKTQCLTGAVKVWGKLKKLGYATSGKRFIVGRLAAEPTLLTAQLQRQLSQTSLTRENFFGVQPRYAPLFERFRTQSPEALLLHARADSCARFSLPTPATSLTSWT